MLFTYCVDFFSFFNFVTDVEQILVVHLESFFPLDVAHADCSDRDCGGVHRVSFIISRMHANRRAQCWLLNMH